MKIPKNKTLSIVIISMLLAASAVFASIPNASAADVPTYAFLAVNPNPVGINQQVQVSMWMSDPPPTAVGTRR